MKSKILVKLVKLFMVIITLVTCLYITPTKKAKASELVLPYDTGYTFKGVNHITGQEVDVNLWRIVMDGNSDMFCIESNVMTYSGGGYVPESFIHSKKDIMSKVTHYGYNITEKTDYDYAVTQVLLWEVMGDRLISTNIPNYQVKKQEIMAKVNRHDVLPSWNGKSHTVKVGESITIDDTNAITSQMILESNKTNTAIKVNGNKLLITPESNSINGEITFNKIAKGYVGSSIVYRKPNYQAIATMKLDNTKPASLNLNIIKLGNVKVQKIDEETGNPLANAVIRFEYDGSSKEVTTDKNGIAELKDIAQGTKIRITEVTAPNGFVNRKETEEVIIEPNNTVSVILNNKAQKGILKLTKKGNKAVSFNKKETEYGDKYSFEFDYQPLGDTTFDIKAKENIIVGGTTHSKKGDIVTTVTTDKNGELVNMPYLYLGKYEAIEKAAPNGFIIDSTPIPFEFSYGGQEVEILTQKIGQTNEFQKLTLSLLKDEEYIKEWKGNAPKIEKHGADKKVFGLYTNQEFIFSNDQVLPVDSLLEYTTVTNGKAELKDLQYPEGNYYFKELDSGNQHKLLEEKYEFEFVAKNNDNEKEIVIQNKDETPLLNKLHFNEFSLKKLNEIKGSEGKYEESKGAIFTLENEESMIIQTVTVNSKSLATFNHIPVGTFYLKEKKTSSEEYQLWNGTYRIESTKDGIKVFDEIDQLIAKQNYGEEKEYLFEVKNDLIPKTLNTGDDKNIQLMLFCGTLSLLSIVYILLRQCRKKHNIEINK